MTWPFSRPPRTTRHDAAVFILLAAVALSLTDATYCAAQAPPAPATSAAPVPSAAVAAVIADAQAKAKAGQFAEAVAALTAAKTPGLPAADKQALDFALADAQAAWGFRSFQSGRFDEMADHLSAALALDQQYPQRLAQKGNDLRRIGIAWGSQGQYEKAITYLEQSLTVSQQLKDRVGEAKALASLGDTYGRLGQHEKVIGFYAQALTVFQQIKDRDSEAIALSNMGDAYDYLSQHEKAIKFDEQALLVYRQVKDRDGEANALGSLGTAYNGLNQYAKAIDFYDQALPIFQQLKDRNDEAHTLSGLGGAYDRLGQHERAIGFDEQVLAIYRQVKDRNGEANALTDLGNAYHSLSQYDRAISYFDQALPIYQQVKNRDGEANALNSVGNAYLYLNEYAKATGFYERALPILQQVKDRDREADALASLGIAYHRLSQHEKAIGFFEQALAIYRQVKDRDREAGVLCNLGNAYRGLSQYAKAIDFYERALPILLQVKDRNFEANVLTSLSSAYDHLGQHDKAIGFYGQALPLYRQVEDRDGEAIALTDLGYVYDQQGEYKKAISFYERALLIFEQIRDRNGEAEVLSNLLSAWSNAHNPKRNPSLAIFLGKQAVNILQSIRADNHSIEKEAQQSFVKDNESAYRNLANLLISQGRLAEALQVLDLLKQEEYLNFNKATTGKSNADTSLLASTANLTPREQGCSASLEAAGGVLRQDAATLSDLQNVKQKPTPTPERQHPLAAATTKEAADESNYQKILASFASAFPKKADPERRDRLASTSNSRDLQAALRKLGSGSVAVYTLASDKRLWLLLVTPDRIVAHDAPLKNANDLDKKILAFRGVLQDPYSDPRPAGKRLYDLLIRPIKASLEAARAKTLLVSLDGNLRYLPLAALSPDGKHYLVETYQTALYTPASLANLTRAPKANWTALAMGVATPPAGFAPLPAVPEELKSVARVAGETGANAGEFPGTRLLDAGFTKSAMLADLGHGYPLVHIASHFAFTGDEATSFLLLGDGSKLTLSNLKALPDDLFSGVDLLTLSACETATGDMSSGGDASNGGRDVENVAVLAQRKGAAAVLASLWSVNDDSTGLLMRDFYRDRKEASETKVEALRQAQLSLLTGVMRRPSGKQAAKRSDLLSAPPPSAPADAPAFAPDPKAPFAHPFYWAPFILIGNAK